MVIPMNPGSLTSRRILQNAMFCPANLSNWLLYRPDVCKTEQKNLQDSQPLSALATRSSYLPRMTPKGPVLSRSQVSQSSHKGMITIDNKGRYCRDRIDGSNTMENGVQSLGYQRPMRRLYKIRREKRKLGCLALGEMKEDTVLSNSQPMAFDST